MLKTASWAAAGLHPPETLTSGLLQSALGQKKVPLLSQLKSCLGPNIQQNGLGLKIKQGQAVMP